MKQLFILSIIFLFATNSKAQEIKIEKTFGGYKITQNDRRLTMKSLTNTLKPNKEAYQLIKSAKSRNVLSLVFAGVGGFATGYSLGKSLRGEKTNWAVLSFGVSTLVVGIPISLSAAKKLEQSVEVYNSGLKSTSYFKPKFKIIANQKGLGLVMSF